MKQHYSITSSSVLASRYKLERIWDQKSLNPVKLFVLYAIGSEETWQKLETWEYLMVSALERLPWEGVLVDRLVREELQIRIYYNSLERSDNEVFVPRMNMEKWLSRDSLGQSWWDLILLDALEEEDDSWVLGLFLFPVVGWCHPLKENTVVFCKGKNVILVFLY